VGASATTPTSHVYTLARPLTLFFT
jgi:hypothetical protein